jgi:hypothetical protein
LTTTTTDPSERERWIARHGSRRLRRMAEEGIEHTATYLDERLAQERPGWRLKSATPGDTSDPRNVPDAALDLLDRARADIPDARLVYWTVRHKHTPACRARGACPVLDWRGYAAQAEYHGQPILFFGETTPA